MASTANFDFQEPLTIMDQTGLRRYTRLFYTFPLSETMDAAHMNAIVAKFRLAVQSLLVKWPFLKLFVTRDDNDPPAGPLFLVNVNQGTLAQEARTNAPGRDFEFYNVLSVKGLKDWKRSSAPMYSYLASARMPPSKLDAKDFFHVKGFVSSKEPMYPHPIYHIGLNFVLGGLVLGITYLNSIIDAQAHAAIFSELARLVREPYRDIGSNSSLYGETVRNIQEIGFILSNALQSMANEDNCDELSYQNRKDLSKSRLPSKNIGECIFSLDSRKIEALRSNLRRLSTTDPRPVTDFEAIAAVVWCAILRARHERGSSSEFESRMGYSLNGRSYLGMIHPERYAHNASFSVTAKLSSATLLDDIGSRAPDATIRAAAIAIRASRNNFNRSSIEKQLVFMAEHNDQPGHVKPNIDLTGEQDISFTSLLYCGGNEDFGAISCGRETIALGKPQYARTVAMRGGNGQCVLLPRREIREVGELEKPFEVYLQLRKDQMDRVKYELEVWTEKVLE